MKPLRDSQARKLLGWVYEDTQYLRTRTLQARQNLQEWAGQGYGSAGSGRMSGHGDPTGVAVVSIVDGHRADTHARDLELLDEHLSEARKHLTALRRLVEAHTNRVNTEQVPVGCRLCALARRPDGQPYVIQTVYSDGLCHWCRRFVERYGTEPHRNVVLWHLEQPGRHMDGLAFQSVLREWHPDEFASFHQAKRRNGVTVENAS